MFRGLSCKKDDRGIDIESFAALGIDTEMGQELFLKFFAECHVDDGLGNRVLSLLKRDTPEMALKENIVEVQRRMRLKGLPNDLSYEDISDIVAFIFEIQEI